MKVRLVGVGLHLQVLRSYAGGETHCVRRYVEVHCGSGLAEKDHYQHECHTQLGT